MTAIIEDVACGGNALSSYAVERDAPERDATSECAFAEVKVL